VLGVTGGEQRAGFEARLAFAKQESRQDAERRTEIALRIALVTLFWIVSVSLLVGWGLTGPKQQGSTGSSTLAAVLAVLLPFVAAVIATKNRQFIIGGVYVVITLAMVLPALGIAGAGG
jgi:formate hydrogenlyase subunit 4